MKFAELQAAVDAWLDSGETELRLIIDAGVMRLQRRTGGLLCIAMLGDPWQGDEQTLAAALRLSGPSLGRFAGALALDPAERQLCLLLNLKSDDPAAVISALEGLANQRDAWQSTLERTLARRTRTFLGRPHV